MNEEQKNQIRKKFGDELRFFLTSNGWDPKKFADRLGMTEQEMNFIVYGSEIPPSSKRIREIESITTTLVHANSYEDEKGNIITPNPNTIKIHYKEEKNSLSRVLARIPSKKRHYWVKFENGIAELSYLKNHKGEMAFVNWQLLNSDNEATLEDQSEETKMAITELLEE